MIIALQFVKKTSKQIALILLMLCTYSTIVSASKPPLLLNMETMRWHIYLPNATEKIEQQIQELSSPTLLVNWKPHSVPGLIQDTHYWALDGRLWYRLLFDADTVAQKTAIGLLLGRILEANTVWLNKYLLGKNGLVDSNGSHIISDVHSLRYYNIPRKLLKEKNNVLLIEIQSLSTGFGITSGPVGIAHSGPAWRYKAKTERPVLFAQGGLLVLMLISLVVGLLTLFALRRVNAEHFAFISLFLLAFVTFGIDSLLFYQSGLKTELLQRIGYVFGLSIPIPLIIYTRVLMGLRFSFYSRLLIGSNAISCIALFFVSSIILYWMILIFIILLMLLTIIHLFMIGIPAIKKGNLTVCSVLIGIISFVISIALYAVTDPVGPWLRSDELGMGLLMLSLLVGYILKLMSMQNQLRDMSLKLVNISEQERKHLARELHDGINQRLATVRLRLQMSASRNHEPELETLSGELLIAMDEMDRVVQGLQPYNLEHHSLAQAMQLEAGGLNSVRGLNIDISAEDIKLPKKLAQHLYRIFQESVQNALKHAEADHIQVDFFRKRNQLTLSIHDDGHGFDQTKPQKQRFGIGMISLRERVSLIGGILHIESHKEKGTHVFVQVDIE